MLSTVQSMLKPLLGKTAANANEKIDRQWIDFQRKRLFIQGAVRTPLVAILAIWIIALIAADSLTWTVAAPWAVGASLFFLVRLFVLRRWLAQPEFDYDAPKVTWFVAGGGALVTIPLALGFLYYSSALSLSNKALLSMMLIGWVGGGMASQTAYPKWSPPWVVPLILAIVLGWFLRGGLLGNTIAFAAMLTSLLMLAGLMTGANALEQSLVAQEENRRLALVIEEQKRVVENALISKSSFLAAASHDLRQPAVGIAMLVSALKEAKTIDSAKAIGATAEKAVAAMTRILDSLLEFSRLDSGQIVVTPSRTNVVHVLNSLLEEFKPQLRPAVRFESQLALGSILIDSPLFEQIARNIISNAIKFTYTGKIVVKTIYQDDCLIMQVTDTGVGIPQQDRDRVFEEYFQVRNPTRDRTLGLGLGLSIVKKSVALLDGTVEIESQIGTGTTVQIKIPAPLLGEDLPISTERLPAQAEMTADRDAITILLIDDDPIVRESFAAALQVKNVVVLAAANAAQAIAHLELNPELKTAFVDYQISDMYDGLKLISVLRERWPQLQCHLITGDPRLEVVEAATRAEVRLLMKPVPFEVVVELAKS
jgi:two-component system, sensor histidine kinase